MVAKYIYNYWYGYIQLHIYQIIEKKYTFIHSSETLESGVSGPSFTQLFRRYCYCCFLNVQTEDIVVIIISSETFYAPESDSSLATFSEVTSGQWWRR